MMAKYLQQIAYATLAWLGLFLIDFGIELFQIVNETRVTFMGLRIQNIDTEQTLTNFFSLTPKFYLFYVLFVLSWCLLYKGYRAIKRKRI